MCYASNIFTIHSFSMLTVLRVKCCQQLLTTQCSRLNGQGLFMVELQAGKRIFWTAKRFKRSMEQEHLNKEIFLRCSLCANCSSRGAGLAVGQ